MPTPGTQNAKTQAVVIRARTVLASRWGSQYGVRLQEAGIRLPQRFSKHVAEQLQRVALDYTLVEFATEASIVLDEEGRNPGPGGLNHGIAHASYRTLQLTDIKHIQQRLAAKAIQSRQLAGANAHDTTGQVNQDSSQRPPCHAAQRDQDSSYRRQHTPQDERCSSPEQNASLEHMRQRHSQKRLRSAPPSPEFPRAHRYTSPSSSEGFEFELLSETGFGFGSDASPISNLIEDSQSSLGGPSVFFERNEHFEPGDRRVAEFGGPTLAMDQRRDATGFTATHVKAITEDENTQNGNQSERRLPPLSSTSHPAVQALIAAIEQVKDARHQARQDFASAHEDLQCKKALLASTQNPLQLSAHCNPATLSDQMAYLRAEMERVEARMAEAKEIECSVEQAGEVLAEKEKALVWWDRECSKVDRAWKSVYPS